jgi:hypothetical protein
MGVPLSRSLDWIEIEIIETFAITLAVAAWKAGARYCSDHVDFDSLV